MFLKNLKFRNITNLHSKNFFVIQKNNTNSLNKFTFQLSKFKFNKNDSIEDIKFHKTNKNIDDSTKNSNISQQIKVEFNDIKQETKSDHLQIKKIKETFEKSKIKEKKQNNINENNSIQTNPENSDLVLIFSQQGSIKYYIYNSVFLGFYIVNFWSNIFSEIPEPLFSTMLVFGSLSHIIFIGLFIFSNRHIKNIFLKRSSKFLLIETFSVFRIKSKSYLVDINKIDQVKTNPLMKKMNLYYFTYKPKFGFFKFFDFFVFRPSNTSQMFDNIFKNKIKK